METPDPTVERQAIDAMQESPGHEDVAPSTSRPEPSDSASADTVAPEPTVGAAVARPPSGTPDLQQKEDAGPMDSTRAHAPRDAAAPQAKPAPTPSPPDRSSLVGPEGHGLRPACAGSGDAECRCNGNGSRPLIYAIGSIGVDFQTEARRDSFRQQMPFVAGKAVDGRETEVQPNPYDPTQLHAYLAKNPGVSDKLTWTLNIESTPIYALEAETPVGMDWTEPILDPAWSTERVRQFAKQNVDQAEELARLISTLAYPPVSPVYRILRDALLGQALPPDDMGFVSRVSVPGVLTNRTTRLYSGQVLPVVEVKSRGLYTWTESALVDMVTAQVIEDFTNRDLSVPADRQIAKNLRAFLDKAYYQFRNLGQTSADRALNYAGTNAFLVGQQFAEGLLSAKYVPGQDDRFYALDSISVSKSPHCRVGSDCQDVVVTFFDPENERRAKVSYLFTIDVSDELPVSLAPVHQFLGQ
ncbi:hypothetical protein [Streptomyces sp. NPDC059787]|uniref:cyanobactin maturation protease PatG family protein n=1 Tax=Streptomyces sp. NPDC059787 TaxID=3346947 RepID=UPI00364EE1D2